MYNTCPLKHYNYIMLHDEFKYVFNSSVTMNHLCDVQFVCFKLSSKLKRKKFVYSSPSCSQVEGLMCP